MTNLRQRPTALLLATLASLVVATCGDSSPQGCKRDTCTSGVWMDIPVTFISASLAQAKVTVCRNDECHDWQLPPVPTSDQPEFPEYFPDAPFLTGYLSMNSDRSISLGIQWSVDNAAAGDGGAVDAGTLLQDGDHYVVTLTTSAGVTSTLLDKTATYQSVQPNGPDCPPLCMSAVLAP